MNTRSQILVIVSALFALYAIFRLLRVQQLRSKYALLWITIGLLLIPIMVFPSLSNNLAEWVGVSTGRALFELAAIGFLFLVVLHFSWELSRLEMRTRRLAEELALLKADHLSPPQ